MRNFNENYPITKIVCNNPVHHGRGDSFPRFEYDGNSSPILRLAKIGSQLFNTIGFYDNKDIQNSPGGSPEKTTMYSSLARAINESNGIQARCDFQEDSGIERCTTAMIEDFARITGNQIFVAASIDNNGVVSPEAAVFGHVVNELFIVDRIFAFNHVLNSERSPLAIIGCLVQAQISLKSKVMELQIPDSVLNSTFLPHYFEYNNKKPELNYSLLLEDDRNIDLLLREGFKITQHGMFKEVQ